MQSNFRDETEQVSKGGGQRGLDGFVDHKLVASAEDDGKCKTRIIENTKDLFEEIGMVGTKLAVYS